MISDKLLGFHKECICHSFIHPFCRFSALHKSYPGNTIHDAVVMSVMPFEFQKRCIIQTGGFAIKILIIIHGYRIVWIKADNIAVFDVNSGYPVLCGSEDVRVIKSNFIWPRSDSLIPVDLASA